MSKNDLKRTNNQMILIIEDSDEDFYATKRVFDKSNLRNPIQRCSEGDEALDYLLGCTASGGNTRPGLVLLDFNLPGTDGQEILRQVKDHPELASIPIMILTTSDDAKDIEACMNLGADSYIKKPINLESLFRSISRFEHHDLELVILPKG
ncbi:MAG: response regulator [Rickettsiales bacterium]|nr:response regulator [Rickettsiales bacterium]